MKKIVYFIMLAFLVTSTSGCKKKCKEPEPTPKDILTHTTWKYVKQESYQNGRYQYDTDYHGWERIFTPSGDYYLTNESHNTTEYGTYTFDDANGNKVITTRSHSGDLHHYVVEKLDKDNLVFYEEVLAGPNTMKYVFYHEAAGQ